MKDFIKYNKAYIIAILIALSIIIISIVIANNSTKNKENQQPKVQENEYTIDKKLVLFGAETITINYNDKYQEPGFYAINENGDLETNLVKVDNNLNTSKAGEYQITYKYGNIEKTRNVIVLKEDEKLPDNPKPEDQKPEKSDNNSNLNINLLTLSLKGENTIRLNTEQKYNEPGYIAKYDKTDITKDVIVTSDYIESTPGNYTVTYTINYKGLKKQIIRGIVVISTNLNIDLEQTPNSYTNSSVTINVKVNGSSFSYLQLPDNNISKNTKTSYKVTKNGTYTFTAYNTSKKAYTKTITINNIDKESPTGTCEATINNDNTQIKVNVKDSLSGIKNYTYNDSGKALTTLTKNTFTYNKKTSKKVSVKVTDKVGNSTNISCKIIDKSYYPVIKPDSKEKIIKQEETDTLKVYITQSGNYYLTRIWAYDPYHQMNKEDSPNYGKELYKPKDLLKNAINNNNLNGKLLVGFNASGFYLKNTYDASSVNYYSGYDKTSVGSLVITDGKVKRNLYEKGDLLTWYITGITPNNKMVVYEDIKMRETNVNDKKNWAEMVINSGIRNTYTFASPVILKGQKTNYTNKNSRMPGSNDSKKGLQLICQINDNNFVLFTSSGEKRNTAINLFMKLGCQTAVNLDGGGSIALLYKSSSSNEIETIVGNGRALPEAGYFREN